jgi:phosphoglycolate phosphatase-like HAD superfamily hydrolase
MHLVMFDIDGTLTETMEIDEECFVRSLAEIHGFTGVDADWAKYKHTTDSGIYHEIHLDRTGRPPSDAEVSRFQQHFVALLGRASRISAFAPVTGARQLLSDLSASAKYRVSLATGGWRDSARLKMASAGMCFDDHPAASADDAHDRESIMRISSRRAFDRYGMPFASTVYVGDGVWDARVCHTLRIPFIGIGSGEQADRLLSEGAVCVFQNYGDADLFLEYLNKITEVT